MPKYLRRRKGVRGLTAKLSDPDAFEKLPVENQVAIANDLIDTTIRVNNLDMGIAINACLTNVAEMLVECASNEDQLRYDVMIASVQLVDQAKAAYAAKIKRN